MSDEIIMQQFSIGLRDIERAVVKKTGTKLNLVRTLPSFSGTGPKIFNPESTTVWSFKSRGKWATHNGNYRGNWSPYIPRNLILRYSQPGDIVLDQFCGGGTTAVEAKLLGRRCIAIDINPASAAHTAKNLEFTVPLQEKLDESEVMTTYEPLVQIGDARNLSDLADESIDLVCTHPPYANIIQYSDGIDGDLSFHDIDEYVEDMNKVAQECHRVLKPGGICSILIGDTRRKKKVIPLGFKTIGKFLEQGFFLKDLIIKRQHNCRTTGFWYTSSIKHNFLLLSQEYLPIFIKQNPENRSQSRNTTVSIIPSISKRVRPRPPDTRQCKTTWVLNKGSRVQEMEANLLNRYGGTGRIFDVEFVGGTNETMMEIPLQVDLLYFKGLSVEHQSLELFETYFQILSNLIQDLCSKIKSGGHLAIRLKDFRDGDLLHCPALMAWKIPPSTFKICEIIIVTSDIQCEQQSSNGLEIEHEYILVYQNE